MEYLDWAKEQCRLYTLDHYDPDEQKYIDGCCNSALKAFKSLLEDGHSGMSINITLRILNNLVDRKPLVPIQNRKEDWVYYNTHENVTYYYHRYYHSLSKRHHDDTGVDEFHDRQRFLCKPSTSRDGVSWYSRFCSDIGHQMFPISFPYEPEAKPYKIIVDEYLTDRQNGDFDTMAIRSIITPDGQNRIVEQYFKEIDYDFVPISKLEFEERRKLHDMRITEGTRENPAH